MSLDENKLKEIQAGEKRRNRALWYIFLGVIFAIAAAILLSSCASNSRTQTQTRTVGIQSGQETNLTETTITTASETSGVDVAAVVSAAVQASQGKILGALDSLKPPQISTPEEPGADWTTLGGAGAGIGLSLLLAWMKAREAATVRKDKENIASDRDDAYERLIEANRQLPPKTSK
jgi:hypothetical protein